MVKSIKIQGLKTHKDWAKKLALPISQVRHLSMDQKRNKLLSQTLTKKYYDYAKTQYSEHWKQWVLSHYSTQWTMSNLEKRIIEFESIKHLIK